MFQAWGRTAAVGGVLGLALVSPNGVDGFAVGPHMSATAAQGAGAIGLPDSGTAVRLPDSRTAGSEDADSTGTQAHPLPELTHEEVRRYSRHLILPDVGMDGQRRLKGSSVLAVGTGGLGSPALMYLAAAGIGRLGLVDDDVVDESNLQRQIIHSTGTLGMPKVESAAARIRDVNPHVHVDTYHEQLTSENALRLLEGYDVVLDGSDNFPTRYLVSDACEMLGVPNVYGAILGFEGQASVFSYQGGPSYRDLLPTPPDPGAVPSCAEGGVLGILPGVIGCIQATEVIKILLDKPGVLSGRLIVYDALKMTFQESHLPRDLDRPAVKSLINYQGFCGFATPESGAEAPPPVQEGFQRIGVKDTVEKLRSGWAPYVLDVRLPQEAAIASLPFVDQLCPHRDVSRIAHKLPQGVDLLVHCKAGARSAKACAVLSEAGFPRSRLYSMDGGILAWAQEIDRSLPVY